ncbi:uncharacterized protein LOC129940282 [Eupeodes corollae]|uniref:uncharacterized protein LOC129940282 n=1 Tax=Eupeodes corollae TaxID=290404 RepID=UPI002492A6CC|nr:uncharacterized protein LOC129940282 [Eupeodes corollae]
MGPKKINLKTSVSDVIAKTAVAKKKALPKLKVILANPYKPIYETLDDSELSQLNDIICSEIKSSGLPGNQFARQNKIKLGLGASLRAIKNKQASCVLVSRSIKPKFIIDQIGSFAKQTKCSVPVFVVDDCDKISTHLFLIRALVVVFPLNISGELGKWIAKRTLPSEENRISVIEKEPAKQALVAVKELEDKVNLNAIYLTKQSNGRRTFVPDVVVKPIQNNQSKNWTGDFISFSNENGTDSNDEEAMDTDQIDEEFIRKQEKALMVLEKIAKSKQKVNVESTPKPQSKSKPNEDRSGGQTVDKKVSDRVIIHEEWENDPSYISLEVHKIQPNPNRKPKNKRNKNKNKNKNKIKVP